jgi:hypothetical protein
MIAEDRKEQIRQNVVDAVNGSAKWIIKFGRDYSQEEKGFACHYGQEFSLVIVGDIVMVPAGLNKRAVSSR